MNRHYPLYPVDHFELIAEMLKTLKEKYGAREAVVTFTPAGERRAISFAQLNDDAEAFSAALYSMGLNGKTMAIIGGNSYRYIIAMFGVIMAGGIVTPIDTEHEGSAFERLIRRAGATAVAADEAFLPLLTGGGGQAENTLITLDGVKGDGVLSFDELLAAGKTRMKFMTFPEPKEDDKDRTAMIVFTSGTTSEQKPVMLSQHNLLTNACGAAEMVFVGARVYTPLPLYHTYGLTCGLLGHMSQGRTVGLCYSLKTMARDLLLFAPHALTSVPLVAEMLYMRVRAILKKMNALEEADRYFEAYFSKKRLSMPESVRIAKREAMGEELSLMSCGGAHLNRKVLDDMSALGVQILEGYGITECAPMVTCNRNEAQRFGSAGLPLPGVQIKIEDGEIVVAGDGISKGYFEDDELTRESFKNGWFYTGDIGNIDSDGFLFITGRKKNLIVFKNGKKVAPEEIEQLVADISLIKETIAYGAAAGDSSDDVQLALLVYPNKDRSANMSRYEIMHALEAEIAKINDQLPAYKQIQSIKLRDAPFEKTASQKIKRNF